jgi:toxin ParE1/3/4
VAVVIWTPQARRDVEAIETYYLDVAPAYADVIVDGLTNATKRLETFPRSGRAVPEVEDEDVREVIYRAYRVIYLYDETAARVEVLSVLHSSKQFGGSSEAER